MREPLRILLAIGSLGGGGSERQLVSLLSHIDRRRFSPHLYLIHDGGALRDQVPADVPVHVFWRTHRPPRINWPGRIHHQQVADLRQVLREWKIQCVYDRNFHTTLVTAPACQNARIPRISTVVSDPEQDLVTQESRFVAQKRSRLRTAYQTADRVVAVSDGVRNALIEDYGVLPEKCVTIYSPIDLERIITMASESPAITLAEGRFHVVGAGRLLEAKGWLDLVVAAQQLVHQQQRSQLHVHLLGDGPLRARLETEIAARNLADHFRLEGFQGNPYSIFRNADLLCHPSFYEGLPNVLLEAMACELPVVATDCRWGPREILQGGQFGQLVSVGDPAALSAAIAASMDLPPSDRAASVAAAREHVERSFGVDRGVHQIEELIEAVCTDARAST